VRALTARSDDDLDPLLAPLVVDAGESDDTSSGSLRLFDAVGRLLDSAAAGTGLVVALEDVHWADVTSLQLLAHLVDRRSAAPVLLLVTRRSTEEPGSERLVGTLAVLARAGAERIRLDGLAREEVGRLLGRVLGPVPDRLVEVVDEATAGNPFFVEEYARLLDAAGDAASTGSPPVPDGVRDVIRQRVGRLPEEGRRLLTAAAVLGRVIEPADAAELADQPLDEALDHLDLALASGLLTEHDDRYAFAHALTRETLYAGVSAFRRVRLHARAAEVLAARVGSLPDAAADIAHHAVLAAPLGEDRARTAYTWLARAAEVALSRQAPVEAQALWLQARGLAEELGLVDERLRAMLGVARSAVRMGTFTEAPGLVTELAREASRLGRWDLVVAGAATFQRAGAWTWRIHGRKDEELIGVFTDALPHVSGADEATLCGTLTIEHQFGWDTAASDAYAARAVRVAREAGDRDLLCAVLLNRLIATAGRADLGGRSGLAEELLAEQPTGEVEVAALFHLGFAQHEEGRVAEAEATMARAHAEAESLTHSGLDVPLAWWRYAVARDHDDPDAERLGREALDRHLGQRFYYGTELQTLHAVLSLAPGERLDRATVEEARGGLHAQRALVAWALLRSGERDLAAQVLGPPPPEHAVDYSIEASLCLRLLVAAGLGRTEEVAGTLRRIDAYTTPLAVYGSVEHLGSFDHFRAVGHRALGDRARALELARAAVATNRACDIRPWLRRSEALLAELEAELPAELEAERKPDASRA
ncbi:MAG TPA: AAA family ATPase, partial [Phycicoccus sp.]|nr:AAA family ATPase [Phycicoccus sp.]